MLSVEPLLAAILLGMVGLLIGAVWLLVEAIDEEGQ